MEHGDGVKRRSSTSRVIQAIALCGALFTYAVASHAQAVSVQFDPAQTKILWTLPDVLHTVHGTFLLTSGNIVFNTETGTASGQFVVNEDTGQSGDKVRDGRMKKKVLRTAQFPTATYQPTHVTGAYRASGPSMLTVDGMFHIYGANHPLRLVFHVNTTGSTLEATTTFGVPYVAWGMRDPSTMFLRVDKVVQMTIDAKGFVQTRP